MADGDSCWFGCYGVPKVLLKADNRLQLVGKWNFEASLGMVGLSDGKVLVARGMSDKAQSYRGRLELAVPDESAGLRLLPAVAAP